MAVFPAVFVLLMAALVTGQHVEINPTEAVVRVGGSLTVLCKVPWSIDSCRMMIGNEPYRLEPGKEDADMSYIGQSLERGECGVHLKHVQEKWNGNISCVLPPQTGAKEIIATMRLIVARAPAEPELITPPQSVFSEGELFTAMCVVPDGRPAANITWALDQEPILTGLHQPIVYSQPGSDLQTISQNLSRTMTAEDTGKRLDCNVEHLALANPRILSRQLVVHYPPKALEPSPITIFGLKIGSVGMLNVTVRANPSPDAQWTVGNQRLTAPMDSDDNTMTALPPQHMGSGYYNITLILKKVAKEDVDRSYVLRVHNQAGEMEVVVRISTMDEPAGVELETGAIVGIVVAVLVLLIAISLIVFAKATDRWCFAGYRGRDHTRSSGESTPAGDVLIASRNPQSSRTDTESAAGGRGRERSRLAGLTARVRAALPRPKDKVQATEAPADNDDKPLADEKKGVVYAELVLSEQPTAEKPLPPTTEYAEIVYTDQPPQPHQKETKE